MSGKIPVGAWMRMALWGGLCGLYFLSPIDLVPDFIPYLGRLDDVLVILAVYRMVRRLREYTTVPPGGGRRQGRTHRPGAADEGQGTAEQAQAERTAWEILEISPRATQGEIHAAYKALLMKYHPDRVAHLGEEFQHIAHRRTVEIQQAYAQLKRP